MSVTPDIRIQTEDFSVDAEIMTLGETNTDIGAIVSFTGICRGEDDSLAALELEHYPGMAEEEIQRIASNAIEKFDLNGIVAIHFCVHWIEKQR